MAVLTGCKFSSIVGDERVTYRWQTVEPSRLGHIKTKLSLLQKPNALLLNGTRSS